MTVTWLIWILGLRCDIQYIKKKVSIQLTKSLFKVRFQYNPFALVRSQYATISWTLKKQSMTFFPLIKADWEWPIRAWRNLLSLVERTSVMILNRPFNRLISLRSLAINVSFFLGISEIKAKFGPSKSNWLLWKCLRRIIKSSSKYSKTFEKKRRWNH